MATYSGKSGIEALRKKVALKSKMLVGESATRIATHLVDESPLGSPYYNSKMGLVMNDVGDYKNSWVVSLNGADAGTRTADTTGAAAVADAIHKGKIYNLQESVFITNSTPQAYNIEVGWEDNPTYGWKAKAGYGVVKGSKSTAIGILEGVALKVSKM